mmetsp:Transcript_64839/g.127311  ORF Transcript_64839/g.127311 Transcript_64839/m.127311 type:complete len:81 (-) Transcript_64839:105-347(-)
MPSRGFEGGVQIHQLSSKDTSLLETAHENNAVCQEFISPKNKKLMRWCVCFILAALFVVNQMDSRKQHRRVTSSEIRNAN